MIKLRALHPDRSPTLASYEVFIGAAGYEQRCIHGAKSYADLANRRYAVEFSDRNVLSFEENIEWFSQSGFSLKPSIASIFDELDEIVLRNKSDYPGTFIVDISSMTRPMIADIVELLCQRDGNIRTDFIYSPAAYTDPNLAPPPQTFSGPVTPAYSGWSTSPELPLSVIIGVGYEYGRSLGILEYLEPMAAWIFVPTGADAQYDEAISRVNRNLLDLIPPTQRIIYDVSRPFECFEILEGLIYGLLGGTRPLIASFGPKIFALVAMLVAQLHSPSVSIWRVSGGQSDRPSLYPPLGPIYRLPVDFLNDGART